MSQVNLLIIVNIGILEMVLVETFRIFRPGMVGASGMGLSYWFAIIFRSFLQPFSAFPDCVCF